MKIQERFLPLSKSEMISRGWSELDILLITGDAYVDHPSFGVALIGRLLEKSGYRVGIIAQPDWRGTKDFQIFGTKPPKLFIGITSGNLDSMVNNYTAAKKKRKTDVYSPGGQRGLRPDRALIVYANRVREVFGNIPIIIGGLEASLRRFAHYDYWQDKVRRSILLDSRADLLVYGMGEKQIIEIAENLENDIPVKYLTHLDGVTALTKSLDGLRDYVLLPSFAEVSSEKRKYALGFKQQYLEQNAFTGRTVVQQHGDRYVVQNPPAKPLTTHELDLLYQLPYTRKFHPKYEKAGGVPALAEVQFSIVTHRGCYGSCAFCALVQHQGKFIQSRSEQSILEEVRLLTKLDDFKGIIHDVGGPTANMYQTGCLRNGDRHCPQQTCLLPTACKNLEKDHGAYINLLRSIRQIPGVKRVFIRSGIRYDLLLADKSPDFLRELCAHHVSGQLKIAPEHVNSKVLGIMRKPRADVYFKFRQQYAEMNKKLGKKQYLVPYFISSHPGCGLQEMIQLAEHIKDLQYNPEQVQDFTPTPMTLATCIYHTGIDPLTGQSVYVPKTFKEKQMQRALLQFNDPKNYQLVKEALITAGRSDLIGNRPQALIPKKQPKHVSRKRKIKQHKQSDKKS